MKKFWGCFVSAVLLFVFFPSSVGATEGNMTRQRYDTNLKYNKNALPAGWKHEPGYTLWRMQRNLPVTMASYKKYRREKAWRNRGPKKFTLEGFALDTLDWTSHETARFLEEYEDYFKFHPAGVQED